MHEAAARGKISEWRSMAGDEDLRRQTLGERLALLLGDQQRHAPAEAQRRVRRRRDRIPPCRCSTKLPSVTTIGGSPAREKVLELGRQPLGRIE